MDIYHLFLTVLGLYGFATKLTAAGATLELYWERGRSCPAAFLSDQRKSDLLHAANCLLLSLEGVVLTVIGVLSLQGCPWSFPAVLPPAAALANVAHILANRAVLRRTGLLDRMEGILAQWRSQRRVSASNDDEVRLYRMIRESADTGRYNALYICLLTADGIMRLL